MIDIALMASAYPAIRRKSVEAATIRPAMLSASVLRGVDACSALEADWQELCDRQHGTVLFQMPGVLRAWARNFVTHGADPITTIVVRDGSRPILIWPLRVERHGAVSWATGAGSPLAQYDEVLLDPGYDFRRPFEAAMEALEKTVRPDFIFMERVRADGVLRRALEGIEPLSVSEAAPYADISTGVPALMASLKSRVVRQQKKRVQRFEKAGHVAFELAGDPLVAEAWLAEAMAIKRNWLKSTGRVSRAFAKPETGNCLADLARALSRPDASPRMIVARLTLDRRTAAIEMGFCHRDAYHLYLGAFDEEFGKFGPGNILTEKMLEWCAANGVHRYDMLAPRSRNKGEWQSGEVTVFNFAVPVTLRGRLYIELVLKRLLPMARKAFYALPAPCRSAIAGITLKA